MERPSTGRHLQIKPDWTRQAPDTGESSSLAFIHI
uniref:Uncharacterized protein n=1 Tax=Anguilla anguilla TaxID=7936 RepID=A0A0E9SYK7_ANGAN